MKYLKKTQLLLVLFFFAITTMAVDCEGTQEATSELSSAMTKTEADYTAVTQKGLFAVQPPVRLTWSLERENINKRATLWNDRNKLGYIYLLSYGKILGYYPVKGKVSSVNSMISTPEFQACADGYQSIGCNELPSIAEDGSYGSNGDAIFGWTDTGVYFEWNEGYLFSDQILPLDVPNWADVK